MKILSIGTDRRLFEEGSGVRSRFIEYGKLFDETNVVIFSNKKHNLTNQKIGENIFLYPTNSRNRWHYIFDAFKISKEIIGNSGNNAVITCQDPFETGLVGYLLSKNPEIKGKTKLHIQIHTDIFSKYFISGHFLNYIRIFLAKKIIPKADAIRVVSESIKTDIINRFENITKNITVLPVFIDKEKIINSKIEINLHKKYLQFDTIFLMVTRLEKEKNISTAIMAFKELSENNNVGLPAEALAKAGLVIVGDGKWEDNFKELVKSLELVDKIIFEKWSKDVYSYYRTADALISTSFYEGYGMIFIEAILSECPIISSNVGIIKEKFTNKENALICDSNDKKCFTNAMTNFIKNPELEKKLSRNAMNLLETENIVMSKEDYMREYKNQFNL